MRVGLLQPVDTVAGVRERLNNLGYDAGDGDDPTALQFRSAVEEFQCDQALPVDGKVGPVTRAALARAHHTLGTTASADIFLITDGEPNDQWQPVAARIRADLALAGADAAPLRNEQRLQDRYSLRCAPQVQGASRDAIAFARRGAPAPSTLAAHCDGRPT